MPTTQRKTWQQKLHDGRQPQVEVSAKDFAGIRAGQRMLIPTPLVIDAYIRELPKGRRVDVATLRKDLAIAHGAEATCPLTTGIFLRIVAEAAHEAYEKGTPLKNITPFWRVVDPLSPTAKKLSFGTGFLRAQQKAEGIA